MVVYQKFGVMATCVMFGILQKLKFQMFRLFILHDSCEANCTVSMNVSETYFENDEISSFIFKCLSISNCISVLPCIFLASWSDKHGRKLLLALPFVGSFIVDLFILTVLFGRTNVVTTIIIAETVYGLCGGTVVISLGCLCYITDSTDHRLRTWSVALFCGFMNTLPLLGMVLQYYWTLMWIDLNFRTLMLSGVLLRMFIAVFSLIYVKWFVVESVFVLGSYHGSPWVNLLTPINVSDTVNCVFKRRLDNMRFFIIALCTIFIFYSTSLYGNILAFPQHFRIVFKFSYRSLIIFSAVFTLCQSVTLWIVAFSARKCRIIDIDLGVFGSISLASSCLAMTFIKSDFMAAVGALSGIASLLIPTSIISVLSKLVERIETGSMYAGIGFLMISTQMIAIPSYQALGRLCYEAGIPEVIFLLSFGLASFGLLFFIYLKRSIAPDLLGHLTGSESLSLVTRRLTI